jgi:hypothetical protein
VVSDGAAAARSSGCCPCYGGKFKAVSSTPHNIGILAAPPDRKTDCPKTSSPVNSRTSPVMVSCWVMASRDITIQVIHSGRVLRFILRLLRLYRTRRQLTWNQAATVNLSRSGVLARGQQPMKPNTPVEIVLFCPPTFLRLQAQRLSTLTVLSAPDSRRAGRAHPLLAAQFCEFRLGSGEDTSVGGRAGRTPNQWVQSK